MSVSTANLNGRHALRLALFALMALGPGGRAALAQDVPVTLEAPGVVLTGIPFDVTAGGLAADSVVTIRVGSQTFTAPVIDGRARVAGVQVVASGPVDVAVVRGATTVQASTVHAIPGWMSVVPPVLAIALALAFRQVVVALFLGIWIGGSLAYGLNLAGLWYGLFDAVQLYVVRALSDSGHVSIIVFSLMIGGMVGIISRNGGTMGIVHAIVGWANSAQRGQLASALLGLAIFFDDYANTLIVGNTMRPITDRLRISREKLAYIVDSTAAPVATLALVTTWIGFQVGLIDQAVGEIEGYNESAYSVFLNTIPYSFYPLLALFFVFVVAGTQRDFGPMLRAERRARSTGQLMRPEARIGESVSEAEEMEAKPGKPQRALNAVIPVLVLVFGTLIGIYVTGADAAGEGASFRDIIGNGDSYKAMVWSSLSSVVAAALLSLVQRILTLEEVISSWYAGLKAMLLAIIILTLAWALAEVNGVLHTADYLVSILGDAISPGLLPAIIFVLSAATAFATGSSWGVMGIMMPLVVPLTWAVITGGAPPGEGLDYSILYASIAGVLSGAVWGDHCSPISDTTILSSMASGCDHIDHVRTQLPYALAVGLVGIGVCIIPSGYGMPWWIVLLAGAGILFGLMRFYGKPVEEVDLVGEQV